VARYLAGPTTESAQFDFLIGEWEVAATRYQADGSVLVRYPGRWSAQHLNEGCMVMDDFRALAPTGQAISSYVTLRTWSPATRRWEMAGLAAFQPAAPAEWHGVWEDGEMRLDARGQGPDGQTVRTRIRFFDIEPNSFAWESRSSRDEGQTWFAVASLIATRVGC
jgi:hypothetical protein